MNTFTSIKYAAILLPALAMGISVASAEDKKCDCPCDSEHAGMSAERSHGRQGAESAAMASERATAAREAQAERDAKAVRESRAEAKATAEAEAAVAASHYLTSKPSDDYFSSNLIGHEVMNRRDNKTIGTVNELLIDENGQIGAVIISTGGVMGLGKKDLAIAWNMVERKVDGENITLSVDVSDDSLVAAPVFARN